MKKVYGSAAEALDGLLQAQLQPGAAVHRRQLATILFLKLDIDTGAQQRHGPYVS